MKTMNKQVMLTAFGSPDVLRITESPIPEPKAGEVRVKIEASTLQSTDTVIRKGIYPLVSETPPFALGYDFVGRVEKLGDGVTMWQEGQRVCGIVQIGGNAEYLTLAAKALFPVPEGLDAAEAVCLVLSWMTAYQMLTRAAKVKRGQKILIQGGSGAVGTALLQLGRLMDLEMVTTASAHKLDRLRDFGATALDYRAVDFNAQLSRAAEAGFDAAFDAVSNASFARSFRLLAPHGKLITYGTYTVAAEIDKRTLLKFMKFGASYAMMMLRNALWTRFSAGKSAEFFGNVDSRKNNPEAFREDLHTLFELLNAKKIQPLIDRKFLLDDAQEAHRTMDGGNFVGQLVFVIAD